MVNKGHTSFSHLLSPLLTLQTMLTTTLESPPSGALLVVVVAIVSIGVCPFCPFVAVCPPPRESSKSSWCEGLRMWGTLQKLGTLIYLKL